MRGRKENWELKEKEEEILDGVQEQDKVNTADSAFIFLIIQSQW